MMRVTHVKWESYQVDHTADPFVCQYHIVRVLAT
jgi:hypothetical protein